MPGYSVPSLVDWNEDGRPDLTVGEGSGATGPARVRVKLIQSVAKTVVFARSAPVREKECRMFVSSKGMAATKAVKSPALDATATMSFTGAGCSVFAGCSAVVG